MYKAVSKDLKQLFCFIICHKTEPDKLTLGLKDKTQIIQIKECKRIQPNVVYSIKRDAAKIGH